ncbi:hypothetical protein D1614_13060 [Maribellus luteus]|uniref:DUF5000 domain-containing protein n=1 Tax=Maribellus luteus TaxID=2305463 RepID=A0A399SZA2_9BACT|nr:DUF4998 domain-containing protein [Maribellus luteus]RIJ48039.1 hypothetical protein D1614_13060 [Maribellus luteus]
MNKIILYKLLLIAVVGAFMSCSDMDEIHQEYTEGGEILYLTKIDSVEFFSGNNRGKLTGILDNAIRVKEAVAYWNQMKDSLLMPLTPTSGIDRIEFNLENLPEGTHEIQIKTKDDKGNQSIGVTVFGVTYGDKYQATLKNRDAQKVEVKPGFIGIDWQIAPENSVAFEICYINSDNEQICNRLNVDVLHTEATDVKMGTTLKHRLLYMPQPTSIDTFYTEWQEIKVKLPEGEFKISSADITEEPLKNDNLGRSWGGHIDHLFDGIIDAGNHYHTGQWNDGPPLTFTYDLGASYKVTRIKIHGRPNWAVRLPQNLEVWTTDNIEGADIDAQVTDEGWEAESIAKGWKKVAEFHGGEQAPSDNIVDIVNFNMDTGYSRYIRVRVYNIWDNTIFLNMSEIETWGMY